MAIENNIVVKQHYQNSCNAQKQGAVLPKTLQNSIRKFFSEYFHNAVLFQISNAHIVLMAKKKSNPDYENRINRILNYLSSEYETAGYDYKVVMGESIDEISGKNEYISFISSIDTNIPNLCR